MSAASFNLNESKWQKIYWNEGPEAAQKYCVQTAAGIEEKLAMISDLIKQVGETAPLKLLANAYGRKQGRYLSDIRVRLSGQDRLISRGRAEQGRSPFSYPDFRRKYDDEKKLLAFLTGKVQSHQTLIDAVDALLVDFPTNPELQKLRELHSESLEKWKARAEASPADFLLPGPQDPHALMGISWSHEQGYLGEGARSIVIEEGIDPHHPALQNALIPTSNLKIADHGTHVSGIIAASKNEDHGHIGAAPQSKILFMDNVTDAAIANSDIDIVHFSGVSVHPLVSLLSRPDISDIEIISYMSEVVEYDINFAIILLSIISLDSDEERDEKLKEICAQLQSKITETAMQNLQDKLFITSNGNDGVVLSEAPRFCEQDAYALNNAEQFIRVVNLMPNGLYPHETSTLPGDAFASSTLCAIGTDILSTTAGNTYQRMTGTSMAAPFVTSVALLIKGAFPHLSREAIRACILESATPIVLDSDKIPHLITASEELKKFTPEQIAFSQRFYGVGLLNAKGAIELAIQKNQATS